MPMVRDHESRGHQGEHDEPQSEGGTAEKEGPRIRLVMCQCGL